MFTVKYRTYNLSPTQNSDQSAPRCYDEVELIYGPFEMISKETDENGYPVLYAHRAGGAEGLTLKHCEHLSDQVAGAIPAPRAVAWVMNEQGATIAKYDL